MTQTLCVQQVPAPQAKSATAVQALVQPAEQQLANPFMP